MRSLTLLFFFLCAILTTWATWDKDAIQELAAGNRKFTASVFKELIKSEKGNFIFSPFAVEVVLALTAEVATGVTRKELVSGLALPHSKILNHRAFKTFLNTLTNISDTSKLYSANKIYASNSIKLKKIFKKTIATNIYKSDIENINFEDRQESARTINYWVEQQTNQKIQNLINPNMIYSNTKLVLVNALYLNGTWANKFDPPSLNIFYNKKWDTSIIPTMSQISQLNYYENKQLNARFLELPYTDNIKRGGLSMVIVLPNEREGLSEIEQNLEKLFEPQPFEFKNVDVTVPKFTTESALSFKQILKSLGINRIFEETAHLSFGLSAKSVQYVSEVIQKSVIDVSEQGTDLWSLVEPTTPQVTFTVRHPFIYYIQRQGVILFAGRITNL